MGDLIPKGDPDLTVFVAVMLLGFLVGTAGHIYKSRTAVILGIVLVFMGTIALPLLVFGSGTE